MMKKTIFIYRFVTLVTFVIATLSLGQEMSLTEQKKKLKEMEQVLDNLRQVDKTKLSPEMREKQILSEKKLEEKIKQIKLELTEEEKRIEGQEEAIKVQRNKDAEYLASMRPVLIKYTEALKTLHLMTSDETQTKGTYRSRLGETQNVLKEIKSKVLYYPSPYSKELKDFHTLFVEALDSSLVYLGKEKEHYEVEDSIKEATERKEKLRLEAARSYYYKEDYILEAQKAEHFEEEQTDYLDELGTASLSLWQDCRLKNYKIVEPSQEYYGIKVPLLYESNVEAQLALGRSYIDRERFNEAIIEYKKALVLSPNSADVHRHLATAYSTMGQLDQAIEEYEKVIRLTPESGYMSLADKYNLEFLEAVKITQRAKKYYQRGLYKKTITEAEKAIEICPWIDQPYIFVIISYLKENQFDKIIPVLAQMVVREVIYYGEEDDRYDLKINKEEMSKAIAKLRDIKNQKFDYTFAYVMMESTFEEKKLEDIDFDQARASFSEEEMRESPLFQLFAGWLYEKHGDKGRALRSLEKASSLDPSGKIGELAREKIQRIKEPGKEEMEQYNFQGIPVKGKEKTSK